VIRIAKAITLNIGAQMTTSQSLTPKGLAFVRMRHSRRYALALGQPLLWNGITTSAILLI
jgi:hypothetical protein